MAIKKDWYPGIHLLAAVLAFIPCSGFSQAYSRNDSTITKPEFIWPEGKAMALSLTFDDARLSQIDTGISLLDKYGVKATFYVSPGNMIERADKWKIVVQNGHDIGNHTVNHPCTGNFPWSRNKALEEYTLQKMMTELDSANKLIEEVLGIRPVSFAYPCGQTFIGRGMNVQSYIPLIAFMFESGRGWLNEAPNDPVFCDLSQLNAAELDGKSFGEVLRLIETAKSNGYWLILAGHEMNEGGIQTSLLNTVNAICKYATDPANGIWIDTVHNIASYLKQTRK
ncbi:MAG: polysaccharide deacetylase family protein [Bacteroidota bacterium]|nr:polysaccharide deacetylase family protein [Bacteroidota bacterium]